MEMEENKKSEMFLEKIKKFQNYSDCLLGKKEALVKALRENNFCEVQHIMEQCHVPPDQMKALMKSGIECYENQYHMW